MRDVLVAVVVLAVMSPVLLAVAALNRLLTGRVVFRQTRVGRGLRPFVMLKFQTMVDRAAADSTVTTTDDRRVTAFGRLLRMTKLDELPQLLNVLRGEMSLVGPRALTPNEVARIPPEVAARVYAVRPGLTGIASLVFSHEERLLAGAADPEAHYFGVILPQKMALELWYAEHHNFWLDAWVLLLTPAAVLWPAATRRYLGRLTRRVWTGASAEEPA